MSGPKAFNTDINLVDEEMVALMERMKELQSKKVALLEQANVADKVADYEAKTKPKNADDSAMDGGVVAGPRWKRKGTGTSTSGTESSSSSSVKVAVNYLPMPKNPKAASSKVGTAEAVMVVDELEDWVSDSEAGPRSQLADESDTGKKEAEVAAKKKAKKERQAQRRKEEKEKARVANLDKAVSSLRLGVHTTVDPKAKVKPAPKKLAHDFNPKECVCITCGEKGIWRNFESTWEKVFEQQTKSDELDVWKVTHMCIPCCTKLPKYEGKTVEEVKAIVFAAPMAAKTWRAGKFVESLQNKRSEFAMMDASNRKIKMMTRDSLAEILAPLSTYIFRKAELLEKVCKDVERHNQLCQQLARCKSLAQEREIMNEMEALEVDDKYMAYVDKGEEQHKYIMAASYSDAWTMIYDKSGRLIGCLMSWYVCMANSRCSGPPTWAKICCARVTPSKDWDTLHDDPLAVGQRWYCDPSTCNAKYKAGWGQLVQCCRWNNKENRMDEMYMRADAPGWDAEDIRAAWTEDNIQATSSMDLYEKVQRIVPAQSNLVIPDPTLKGQMMLASREAFNQVPFFSWWEIFGIMGVPPPKGVKPPAVVKLAPAMREELEEV